MTDPRELPTYTIAEAAHYLTVPVATVRYWSVGRGGYASVITVPDGAPTLVSFLNLVELHVLAAIRCDHDVRMASIRRAISYLAKLAHTPVDRRHPLVSQSLETDGLDLFIDRFGQFLNVSRDGQGAMREIINKALRRIDRDRSGVPVRVYPFTRPQLDETPRLVVIDPKLSGGRPVIAGTGLATQVIAERYKLGESIQDLAHDYERPNAEIEEAIRCELQAAA